VDLTERIDWFDFEIYYNLGGATYTHRELMAMLRRTAGENYLKAGDQWFLIEDPAKLELMERTFFRKDEPARPLRDQAYNLIFFRQLLREQGINIGNNQCSGRRRP
jgi:hypothetical protein